MPGIGELETSDKGGQAPFMVGSVTNQEYLGYSSRENFGVLSAFFFLSHREI